MTTKSSVAFVLLATALLAAQHSPDVSDPPSFAGCYEIKMGRWWPWGFGEDNKYVAPAASIELSTEVETQGFGEGHYAIRSIPPANGRRASFWLVTPENHIVLIWEDGFTGVSLNLEKDGDGLHGWAHPRFDTPQIVPRIAREQARRKPCNQN